MLRFLVLLAAIATAAGASAQEHVPDGTIVMSYKNGLVGRIARRITGGDKFTHVGVVIDGQVIDSDFPRVHSTPVSRYGKRRTVNYYYVPTVPYNSLEVSRMRSHATSRIGEPYRLRNYFFPNSSPTNGTWCSPFAGQVLNASGRYNLSRSQYHEPQNLLNAVGGGYRFSHRVVR